MAISGTVSIVGVAWWLSRGGIDQLDSQLRSNIENPNDPVPTPGSGTDVIDGTAFIAYERTCGFRGDNSRVGDILAVPSDSARNDQTFRKEKCYRELGEFITDQLSKKEQWIGDKREQLGI